MNNILTYLNNIDSNYIFIYFLLFFCTFSFYIRNTDLILDNQKIGKENDTNYEKEKPVIKQEIKYEDKYYNDYLKLEDDNNNLEYIENNYIIEKTPLGNVIMVYNKNKESFEYYSDSTIPYRFLETIARKYVITFRCKSLYVDMNVEIENAKKKKEYNEEQKKILKVPEKVEKTKDIFAKLKNYNQGPSQNYNNNNNNINSSNISVKSNNNINNNKTNENMILKENANRYTCKGRMSNFNILKKIDKKLVNNNYALSYKDFLKAKLETKD